MSGVRVAVIDSGINPDHPHVRGVAGGIQIISNGENEGYLDHLGHGTAVAGAIREKVPDALLYAVKIFKRTLSTNIETTLRAMEWCIAQRMDVINLSLGTLNPAHRGRFEQIIPRASQAGAVLVAAREVGGQESLPGCLPGLIGVALDWDCPRTAYRISFVAGRPIYRASGYPRPIPGIPPDDNLHGTSFAVANMTGFVARARQIAADGSFLTLERILLQKAA